MKKSQFDGVDYAVVQKFKVPIEKFNTNDDLQNWAEIEAKKLSQKDFGGRQEETKCQRKAMIKEWADYVLKENDAYNKATALLILNAITEDLKQDNDNLPPVLNKGVLADCISQIDKNIKADKKYQFALKKMYETKLCALYLEDTDTGETGSKWVIIPSKEHDPENFEANVEKLKTLSHKNWCTKSFNAEPYLADGDFHVYLENGKPKLGVRFIGDKIVEIQGGKNNGEIPFSYIDEMKNHIEENGYKLGVGIENEIYRAEKIRSEVLELREGINYLIENKDAKTILECFDIEVKEDSEGLLTISKFGPICEDYSYKDIGIDENWLIKNVKHIIGDANFENSQIKDFVNLKSIGGDARFTDSQVKSLGSLETIGGNACFKESWVEDLGNLQSIGGDVLFGYSQIQDLGNLQSIGGDALFTYSKIQNLGNLKSIGGEALFGHSQIQDLGNLKSIGGNADFSLSKVQDLGNLQSIGRNANFINSQIKSLGKLERIGGDVHCWSSQVEDLGSLQCIGGDADFRETQVQDLGNLERIGGNADFRYSQIKSLGNLQYIGGEVYTKGCLLSVKDKLKLSTLQIFRYNKQNK